MQVFLNICCIASFLALFICLRYRVADKYEERRYRQALGRIDGAVFFAYNTKRDIQRFVQTELIPRLPPNVEVMFLNGRRLEPDQQNPLASRILFDIPTRMGFPYLIRVHQQTVYAVSIRTSTYNTMRQGKSVDELMVKITEFYTCENPAGQPLALRYC